MFNHRIRIASSLLIAFLMVTFYGKISTTPFISPIEADSIKNLLSNIKFPSIDLSHIFTLKINPEDNNLAVKQSDNSEGSINFTKPAGSGNLIPTLGSENPTPTFESENPTPTIGLNPSSTPSPKPTNKPKPTPTPRPPPITSDVRPGNSLKEIFQDVSKRMCVPVALIMAFQTEETGPWFKIDEPASKIKIYNTYGWWKTGAGNPCTGFGFHGQTGIIPADSVNAGGKCQNPVGNPNDIAIMGIFQISQWMQDATRKYTILTLPNNIDRRVIFDAALIFAQSARNNFKIAPSDCNNWTDAEIRTVAEKYHGTCIITENATGGNYCNDIVKLYKQFK